MNENIENQIIGFAVDIYNIGYVEGVKDGTIKSESYISGKEQEAYDKGLREAWECAKTIISPNGERRSVTNFEVFGVENVFELTANQAIKKLKEYEEVKQWNPNGIEVGDEVYQLDDDLCIVTMVKDDGYASIVYGNGSIDIYPLNLLKKTGRHFPQIAEVFAQIQEAEKREVEE